MPAHPMLHAFGALLIYRQQETGLQCKPGSRGHHAHNLRQPEQHGSICVLDKLSWVSASHRGRLISSMSANNSRPNADFKPVSFLSVGTKQQSRLKYSQSLMSIPFDMDLKNRPVQINNNDLNQTNHDHAGLDIKNGTIIDPSFLQFKLNVESTVEPSVKEVLKCSQPRPLPPEDTAKMLDLRDLCEQSSCEHYLRVISMTGYDIATIQ